MATPTSICERNVVFALYSANETANELCSVLEAMFLHEMKPSFSAKVQYLSEQTLRMGLYANFYILGIIFLGFAGCQTQEFFECFNESMNLLGVLPYPCQCQIPVTYFLLSLMSKYLLPRAHNMLIIGYWHGNNYRYVKGVAGARTLQ